MFTYSSNIGTARMALVLGVEGHQWFLKKIGQLDRLRTELPESAEPIVPKHWGELNTMTIAFGQGLYVAPMQAVMAVGALVNGGYLIPPTFLNRSEDEAQAVSDRGDQARDQRKDALSDAAQRQEGLGTQGQRPRLLCRRKNRHGGKGDRRPLFEDRLFTTFMACMPADKPRYIVAIMLDEPQPLRKLRLRDRGLERRADAGKVIARIAPLLGLGPAFRSAASRAVDPGETQLLNRPTTAETHQARATGIAMAKPFMFMD